MRQIEFGYKPSAKALKAAEKSGTVIPPVIEPTVHAIDHPDGIPNEYRICIGTGYEQNLVFQSKPITEIADQNGVTIESLLAVCADRLSAFQAGPFKCAENEKALAAIGDAIAALDSRTERRVTKGLEGKLAEEALS